MSLQLKLVSAHQIFMDLIFQKHISSTFQP